MKHWGRPRCNLQALVFSVGMVAMVTVYVLLFEEHESELLSAEPTTVAVPVKLTEPTLANRPYKVDVLLVYYTDETGDVAMRHSFRLAKRVKEATGCERVVTYPASYMPVLISKRRYGDAKELLGDELLSLTKGLERRTEDD